MRRKQDERNHKPCIGLLKADGSIKRHYLDVSKDQFNDPVISGSGQPLDLDAFVEGLEGLGSGSLDYSDAVAKYMEANKVSRCVRRFVLECLEGRQK